MGPAFGSFVPADRGPPGRDHLPGPTEHPEPFPPLRLPLPPRRLLPGRTLKTPPLAGRRDGAVQGTPCGPGNWLGWESPPRGTAGPTMPSVPNPAFPSSCPALCLLTTLFPVRELPSSHLPRRYSQPFQDPRA